MGFGLDPKDLRPGDVLEGDCFPEPVRVIQIQVWGDLFRLEAVGTRTQGYYDRVLSIQDLGSLRRFRASGGRDFGERPRPSSWRWRGTASASPSSLTPFSP